MTHSARTSSGDRRPGRPERQPWLPSGACMCRLSGIVSSRRRRARVRAAICSLRPKLRLGTSILEAPLRQARLEIDRANPTIIVLAESVSKANTPDRGIPTSQLTGLSGMRRSGASRICGPKQSWGPRGVCVRQVGEIWSHQWTRIVRLVFSREAVTACRRGRSPRTLFPHDLQPRSGDSEPPLHRDGH